MAAELLWLLLAVDPAVGNPATSPMFRKAPKLAVTKSRHNPRGDGQVARDAQLAAEAVSSQTREIRPGRSGASYNFQTAFTPHHSCYGNVCIRMHRFSYEIERSLGWWHCAYLLAVLSRHRRECVRAMGRTDATPFFILLSLLMRAWLEQPHGRHHKAPPQPCALTTGILGRTLGVYSELDRG